MVDFIGQITRSHWNYALEGSYLSILNIPSLKAHTILLAKLLTNEFLRIILRYALNTGNSGGLEGHCYGIAQGALGFAQQRRLALQRGMLHQRAWG